MSYGVNSCPDLQVWHRATDLAEEMYKLSDQLPKPQTYGLTAQLQRAAVSIPSNIAEGHARGTTKEFLRFLSIALGSVAEVETQLVLANRLSFLRQPDVARVLATATEVGKMVRGLQQSLRTRLEAVVREPDATSVEPTIP